MFLTVILVKVHTRACRLTSNLCESFKTLGQQDAIRTTICWLMCLEGSEMISTLNHSGEGLDYLDMVQHVHVFPRRLLRNLKRAAAEGSPAGGTAWAKATLRSAQNPRGLAALVSVTGPASAAVCRNSPSRWGIPQPSREPKQRSKAR